MAHDDPSQNKRIDTLLAVHGAVPGSLLVTDVVLAEAAWTLKSAFEQDKHAQSIAVRSLLEETASAFEDREAVAAALSLFEASSCGFADCLVVATHARQGCDFTATFDRGMHKLPGVKVLWHGWAARGIKHCQHRHGLEAPGLAEAAAQVGCARERTGQRQRA